jgi:protocatechuate 4,5-dioxygenase alpha chain
MNAPAPSALPDPGFDLEPPGTYLYTGQMSSRGYRLNNFALGLKDPSNRAAFLADEDAYVRRHGLTDAEMALVRARDWTGLLRAGGHLQAVLKLAATLGLDLYHVGAHNIGTDHQTLYAACPRKVAALPRLDKVQG